MFNTEAFEASLAVIRAFEKWKIDYLVGGSLASSYHGMPRATPVTLPDCVDADVKRYGHEATPHRPDRFPSCPCVYRRRQIA